MTKRTPSSDMKDIVLSTDDQQPIYLQLCSRFKSAIAEGRLAANDRLPSVRALASELGLSRGTVNLAYQVLAEEGYVEFRGSAGTFVDTRLTNGTRDPSPTTEAASGAPDRRWPDLQPLQLGLPALDAFPRKTWNRLVNRHSRQITSTQLGHVDPAGLSSLRERIAAYLSVSRGITCQPEQVFVTAGHRATLGLIMRALYPEGDEMWFEEPGYRIAREFLLTMNVRLWPIPVDRNGIVLTEARRIAPDARFALVTPANQSPLGVMLSLERRAELLGWAAEGSRWVIEDDYDSEYRYNRRPPLPLMASDRRGRVIFTGSFSKVLFPALRLAYLVVPHELVETFTEACYTMTAGCPEFHQTVVAEFMAQGLFVRHMKRMRALYTERRQFLVDALSAAFGDAITISSPPAGLHLVLHLEKPGVRDTEIARIAQAEGLGLQPLSPWYFGSSSSDGLILGFTNILHPQMAQSLAVRLRDICLRAGG